MKSKIGNKKMNSNIKKLLLGIGIGIITTSIFFLMIGEVETEIRIGSSFDNEKVAILFSEKNIIEIINLDPDENITINVKENNIDFEISSKINETEEVLMGETLQFKYPEGLLKDEEINIKLIIIN